MSVMGSSLASAVAQTPVQTQQVTNARDKAEAQSARDARNIRDLFQAQNETIEEDETDEESPSNPHVDQHTPEGRSASYQPPDPRKRRPGEAAAPGRGDIVTGLAAITDDVPVTPDSPLYKHVDVQA